MAFQVTLKAIDAVFYLVWQSKMADYLVVLYCQNLKLAVKALAVKVLAVMAATKKLAVKSWQ